MSDLKAYTDMSLVRAHQAQLHRDAAAERLGRVARGKDTHLPPAVEPRRLSSRRVAAAFAAVVLGLTVAAGVVTAQSGGSAASGNGQEPGCAPSRTQITAC